MARTGVPGVVNSNPMVEMLPAILRTDDFAADFVGGLDEVLAPVLLTIDNLTNYVDPEVAPLDFVGWLATWFGIELDVDWSEQRARETIKRFARLQRFRGTMSGLVELVEILTGDDVQIDDGGGVWTTFDPNAGLEGEATRVVKIRTSSGARVSSAIIGPYLPPGVIVEWE